MHIRSCEYKKLDRSLNINLGFSYFEDLKHLLKIHLAYSNQISYRASRGGGNKNFPNHPGHMINMATMP